MTNISMKFHLMWVYLQWDIIFWQVNAFPSILYHLHAVSYIHSSPVLFPGVQPVQFGLEHMKHYIYGLVDTLINWQQ